MSSFFFVSPVIFRVLFKYPQNTQRKKNWPANLDVLWPLSTAASRWKRAILLANHLTGTTQQLDGLGKVQKKTSRFRDVFFTPK